MTSAVSPLVRLDSRRTSDWVNKFILSQSFSLHSDRFSSLIHTVRTRLASRERLLFKDLPYTYTKNKDENEEDLCSLFKERSCIFFFFFSFIYKNLQNFYISVNFIVSYSSCKEIYQLEFVEEMKEIIIQTVTLSHQ